MTKLFKPVARKDMTDEQKEAYSQTFGGGNVYTAEFLFDYSETSFITGLIRAEVEKANMSVIDDTELPQSLLFQINHYLRLHFHRKYFLAIGLISNLQARYGSSEEKSFGLSSNQTAEVSHKETKVAERTYLLELGYNKPKPLPSVSIDQYVRHLKRVEEVRKKLSEIGVDLEPLVSDAKAGGWYDVNNFAFVSEDIVFDSVKNFVEQIKLVIRSVGEVDRQYPDLATLNLNQRLRW